MGVTKIFINKIRQIDMKRLNLLAEQIAKNNNLKKSYVKRDMLRNFLKYKIGYTDYFKGDYVNLTKEEKKNFVTSKNFIYLMDYLNPEEYRIVMFNKLIFNKIYKKYLKREFIDVRNSNSKDLEAFLKNKKNVFAKPITNFGGHGIEKIKVSDIKDIKKFRKDLLSKKQYLLEEEIKQHKVLDEINPHCVASLRIATLYKDGKVMAFDNIIRIGLDDNPALACRDGNQRFDNNGIPLSKFWDDDGYSYDKHPLTGYNLKELKKLPYVSEAVEMVKEAAKLVPELRYIGWDVALTEDGPAIIEGNEFPSYGPVQNFMLNPNKKGHLKEIRDFLGDELDNLKL